MTGSKDLQPSTTPFFPNVFYHNQFKAKPQWPTPGTTLSGKTTIITGSNTGLGYKTALQLLDLKLTHLIIAVRSLEKGNTAATKLRKVYKATVEVWELDMCSYTSIQSFARRVDTLPRIDIVILNAGVMKLAFSTVPSTGHEETLQVNYLSTILLALLLLPILKAKHAPSEPAHLTLVSADLTLIATFPNRTSVPLLPSFSNPKTFDAESHYRTSKLLVHFFVWKLVDFVSADDVIVNLADPAWVKGTQFTRDVKGVMRVGLKVFEMAGRTPRVGASCFVDAVVNKGRESHGWFMMSWEVHPFPPLLYTPEGTVLIERAWEETLDELDFASVRQIVESMKR
ncbi:NAD(P)-binding protein [Cadophora sp. DSE1049]|nr:NAD(P)-binding protein [Cadophora sp. DSE1049]